VQGTSAPNPDRYRPGVSDAQLLSDAADRLTKLAADLRHDGAAIKDSDESAPLVAAAIAAAERMLKDLQVPALPREPD